MAKDIIHELTKQALENDGWTITDDPYNLKALGTTVNIDLGAEKLIAATKDKKLIAVEIKTFIARSMTYEFHRALGQYMNYYRVLRKTDPYRKLFLSVPEEAYFSFFKKPEVWEAVQDFKLNLIVIDDIEGKVIFWFDFEKEQSSNKE